jgi:tRNA(His) 5'-end guanylyltransferase
MQETTKYLIKKTNAIIGYTQSDEISLLWLQDCPYSQMFFGGKIQKIVSVLAGMASAKFTIFCLESGEDMRMRAINYTPAFDCRVFQLPNKEEAANTLLWREKDATKNAISMAARAHYKSSELQNKTSSEMQEMLFQKGINFNDYPAFFKRGSFFRKVVTEKSLTDEELLRIPKENRPETGKTFSRFVVERIDMPNFTKVKNREAVIFNQGQPET